MLPRKTAGYIKVGVRMKRFSRHVGLIVLIISASVGSYLFGIKIGRAHSDVVFSGALASVQADLGLTKLLRLRELEKDLSHGCSTEALAKIRIDIENQLYVLSSLYKDHKSSGAMDGISKREPGLPSQLESFSLKNGGSWVEPKCTK